MATRYISAAASGSGDGTSVALAWTWSQAASGYTAGDTVVVVADAQHSFGSGVTFSLSGSAASPTRLVGANASGIIDGTRPVLKATATFTTMLTMSGLYVDVDSLDIDGDGKATNLIDDGSGYARAVNCKLHGATGSATVIRAVRTCQIYSNGGGSRSIYSVEMSEYWSNGGQAIITGSGAAGVHIEDTLIYDQGGDGGDVAAVYLNAAPHFLISGMVIDGCAQHGVYCNGNAWGSIRNTIVSNIASGKVGFTASASNTFTRLTNCAGYNPLGTNYSNLTTVSGFQALSGDPYTNRASKNFSSNTTSGAGALLRAMGTPGTYPRALTVGYRDVGVQHQDAGGGISPGSFMIALDGGQPQ